MRTRTGCLKTGPAQKNEFTHIPVTAIHTHTSTSQVRLSLSYGSPTDDRLPWDDVQCLWGKLCVQRQRHAAVFL